jgi:3-hydroxyisobutyrate dehydrogenase-like beta-hydroxyacid dehydrogenase
MVDLSGQLPGSASHAKIVGTAMVIQMIESISEAHVLAEKTGLPAESLHQVINAVFGGPFTVYSKRMMSGSYFREVRSIYYTKSTNLTSEAGHSNWNCKSCS